MAKMTKEEMAQTITAVSAAFGLLAFAFAVWLHFYGENKKAIYAWQRVIVGSIVEKSYFEGGMLINFDGIRGKYLDEVQQAVFKVPKKEIGNDALKSMLQDLRMQNLIVVDFEGYYRPNTIHPYVDAYTDELRGRQRYSQLVEQISAILSEKDCQLTIDQLRVEIMEDDKELTRKGFYATLNDLLARNNVYLNEGGKLCSIVSRRLETSNTTE